MRGKLGIAVEVTDKLGRAGADSLNSRRVIRIKYARGVYYRAHIEIGRIGVKRRGVVCVTSIYRNLGVVRKSYRGNTRNRRKYRAVQSHSESERTV